MGKIDMFLKAILAGAAISIGGAAFLSSDSRAVGAALFSVGLFAVCTLGLNLFTGKICYIFQVQKKEFLPNLAGCGLIWLGNLAGTFLCGVLLRLTRLNLVDKAQEICQAKLNDTPQSVFVLAIFCNILIYLAVESYRSNPHQLGKYLGLFLGVSVFVAVGFEHCVANMFYIRYAGMWSPRALLYVLLMTLGNALGGVLIPLARTLSSSQK